MSVFLSTEVVGRYFNSSWVRTIPEQDFPELSLMGLGVRTSVSRLLGIVPVELSVGWSFNALAFGDIVDFSTTSIGVQVGKQFGLFGLYGGVASDAGWHDGRRVHAREGQRPPDQIRSAPRLSAGR